MRALLPLLVVGLGWTSSVVAQNDADDTRRVYEQGVVGLQVTYQRWDEDRPWTKQPPQQRDASAAVVADGSYLLTTADMVNHATFIQLVTFGRVRDAQARVVRVDRTINLALLQVDDGDLEAVAVARTTPTTGVLRTVRWRRQQLESTASRVIRFEVETSWSGRVQHAFLHMRTDLTNGGWSEPVFSNGELVGLTVSQAGQISRAIPAEILSAFLARRPETDDYVSFPTLGVLWQVNRDVALASFLGQSGEPRGALIRQVPWGSSGCGVLKRRDVLVELDGHPIDAEGFYLHPRLGRLKFNHLFAEQHRPGDEIPATVVRDGRELDVVLTARPYPAELDLIPSHRQGPPPFVIAGGLVFRELDVPYLQTWGKDWSQKAPVGLLTRYFFWQEAQSPTRRREIMLLYTLPSPYNIGYQGLRNQIVQRINGHEISSIPDVVRALEDPQDGFQVIDLAPDGSRRQVILDAATFEQATAEIIESYGAPTALRLSEEPLPPGGGECPDDF